MRLGNQGREARGIKPFLYRNDLDLRIDRVQGLSCGLDFRRADRLGAVQDLALQVGEVDFVAVGDREPADAGRGEVERGWAAEPACADDQRARRAQPLLALDPELGKEDVPAVPEKLVVVQLVGLAFGASLCATVGDCDFTGSPLRNAIACVS
jgi:hypothetical protein